MVCSSFSEERRLFSNFVQKIIPNFNDCNYDQNSSKISCQQIMRLFLNSYGNSYMIIFVFLDRLDLHQSFFIMYYLFSILSKKLKER